MGTGWIQGTEQVTWDKLGRHRQAYQVLLGERSQRMGKVLGWRNIEHDARCLACHATLPVEWMQTQLQATEMIRALREDERAWSLVVEGVSCEACHGAAGPGPTDDKPGWLNAHITWRPKSPKDKEGFGFYDVRSPASRTRMCASCHVGDADRGRVVTHEMYAAGHPPLPAFEVETFLRDMPPHWRVLDTDRTADSHPDAYDEKPAEVTEEFLAKTNDPYLKKLAQNRGRAFERTRSLAVGAIVTWGQNARLTASLASNEPFPLSAPEGHWPELAAFECASCHHDLKVDGWRAQRFPATTPGRPALRHWSSPLFDAVCRALSRDGNLPQPVQDIEQFISQATREQPFGNAEAIAAELNRVALWSDKLADRLEQRPFSAAQAKRLLQNIAEAGKGSLLDYESARHLVWAFDEVLRELDPKNELTDLSAIISAAKRMFVTEVASLDDRETVQLDGDRTVQLINLQGVLERAADYDAVQLQAVFKRLHSAVEDRL